MKTRRGFVINRMAKVRRVMEGGGGIGFLQAPRLRPLFTIL